MAHGNCTSIDIYFVIWNAEVGDESKWNYCKSLVDLKEIDIRDFHFGFFHFGYLVFIFAENTGRSPLGLGLLICTLAFAFNHYFSYRYHREVDASGTPNIGTLMFTPYLRVVPMHLTIVFGAVTLGSTGILVFGLMKMIADVAMHLAEHKMLAGRSKSGLDDSPAT